MPRILALFSLPILVRLARSSKASGVRRQTHLTAVAFALFTLLAVPSASAQQQHPTLVSVNSAGTGSGNRRSGDFGGYKISADGRFVLFYSESSNITANNTDSGIDLYVRDLLTSSTQLVSVNRTGDNGGNGVGTGTIINDDGPNRPATKLQFSQRVYVASEDTASVNLTVTRTGDLSGNSTVRYETIDDLATETSDYTAALGTLRFAPNEASKTFTVFLVNDGYMESSESLKLVLSNPTGAALGSYSTAFLAINDTDFIADSNPLNDNNAQFFVRQHYLDFFSREPDASGLGFWTNQLTSCGSSATCRALRRINVSAAFFLSIEFQQTGYLVYRLHQATFNTGPNLSLRTFLPDTQEIGRGVVVGASGWEQQLEANKQSFVNEFVTRAEFTALYPPSMPAAEYVDALNANTGGALSVDERNSLAAQLGDGSLTRAQALRAITEDADFTQREFNRAFVLMQYFGYLRRNPDAAPDANLDGYHFWLAKLDEFGGNFVNAEMVKAFITSGEYRGRFGPE